LPSFASRRRWERIGIVVRRSTIPCSRRQLRQQGIALETDFHGWRSLLWIPRLRFDPNIQQSNRREKAAEIVEKRSFERCARITCDRFASPAERLWSRCGVAESDAVEDP
jgi:hypothetical protein